MNTIRVYSERLLVCCLRKFDTAIIQNQRLLK
jgi:hypothetical protein